MGQARAVKHRVKPEGPDGTPKASVEQASGGRTHSAVHGSQGGPPSPVALESSARILWLQRTAGNAAVARLVQPTPSGDGSASPETGTCTTDHSGAGRDGGVRLDRRPSEPQPDLDPAAGLTEALSAEPSDQRTPIQRKARDPETARPALVERYTAAAVRELDTGDPSYKVLLQTFLLAGKYRGLKQFGLALAERDHARFGTYLNAFLIYIHARGGERLAQLMVENFGRAGLGLLKSGAQPPDDKGLASATGAGVGSVIVYEGKTLVKIGGTQFYISGKPPDYWKGKTTSVLFVVNKNEPKKMYRLDYDVLKNGPKAGVKGWEHNQKGVAKVLGLDVTNHQPAGGWGRAAGRAILVFKWGGRAFFVIGIGSEVVEVYRALDRRRAVVGAVASIGGGAAGAMAGAAGGARFGSRWGPWGAVIGGAVGGVAGGIAGAKVAKAAAQMAYDLFVTPLEKETWVAFEEREVEPAGSGAR